MSKPGTLVYTHAAGILAEEMTLEEAKADCLVFFPDAVEYDAGDAIWFYIDQNAYDRDENNADCNAGVIATWKETKEDK